MRYDLTAEHARFLFTYDPEEGLLRWRFPAGMGFRYPAGSIAGGTSGPEPYRKINVNGRLYLASRLIWLYMTGDWPPDQIDHADTIVNNDKWDNLRLATGSQNKANCRKYRQRDGKPSHLPKGVQAVQKRRSIRYRAIATKGGVREHLGYFDTPELAHAAYLERSRQLHGEFSRSD